MPHLLKRLELNGFKSFAGKTTLEFPKGITAIVGPNGSGKSNVIDAIRWLLGERDAKNLRGGKGEDLIFAGSLKRARMGQAQASLHFENHKHFFPVDVAEVEVLRQVNRDGTNQYFLNKSEIRLKDLIDFFAQARLGSRGLTVISQGNSDLFIRVTPKERRAMIEEILGLREYQLKKADAERRLKNTGINLDKTHALIDEILPHLRSLKRQTNRWEKRSLIQEELTQLENQYFGSQWHELKAKDETLKYELSEKEKSHHTLKAAHSAAQAGLEKLESNAPREREELKVLKEHSQTLREKRNDLEKRFARLEAELEIHEKSVGASVSVPAAKLLELVREIKSRLEVALGGDSYDLPLIVKELVGDIEDALKAGNETKALEKGVDPVRGREGQARVPSASNGVEAEFKAAAKDIEAIGKEIAIIQEKEKTLEKNQESFYGAFKEAVAAVRAAESALEIWGRERERLAIEEERVTMRREELGRQITQAGREGKEFETMQDIPTSFEGGSAALEHRILRLRGELASMGEVDEALIKEAKDTEARYEFLTREMEDLEKAQADLRRLIRELTEKVKIEFEKALVKINTEFGKFFELMFGGGQAKLKIETPKVKEIAEEEEGEEGKKEAKEEIIEEEESVEEGIEVQVSLPRKRINSLEMLSGGERSLVGIAALFALISVSPPPFLVLDEIDAPLDDRNARRFAEMLKEFAKETQFVVVTHNRATMEAADVLYGVTLNEDGTSKIVSMSLPA